MSIDTNGRLHVTGTGRFELQARSEPASALTARDRSEPDDEGEHRSNGIAVRPSHLALEVAGARRALLVRELRNLSEDLTRVTARVKVVSGELDQLDAATAWDLAPEPDDDDGPDFPDTQATAYRGPTHVDDVVHVPGHGRFERRRATVYANAPYAIRVQVERELTGDEARHLAQLVGYDYSKTGGERMGDPTQDAPNSIVLAADTTKGRAYQRLESFEENLASTVRDGSPARKTSRTGPVGSRLVEGLGDVGAVHIYYDSISPFGAPMG
jgi:hypothetical protein